VIHLQQVRVRAKTVRHSQPEVGIGYAQAAHRRIPSVRISPDNATVLHNLGLLADLRKTLG
jgi:hypothetical protein